MSDYALKTFIDATRSAWGPLTSELAATVRDHLAQLMRASASESWLAELLRDRPASRELYRDLEHGFVLLAHTEQAGLYRPPHDHGRSWVIYAVQSGASEMGTYGRTVDADGRVRLVKRNATLVNAGAAQVYLPGDIHDTLCMTDSALLFRFTERDLKIEDSIERQVTRYVEHDGVWTAGPR